MTLAVTLAQINPTTGAVAANRDTIVRAYERAAEAGADLVVFPEMAIPGYCALDLLEDGTFLDANEAALARIAEATGATAAIVGFVDRDDRGRYNAAAVLQNGTVRGITRKVNLPDYRYFDEGRYFTSGRAVEPIDIAIDDGPVAVGVVICEDLWDAEDDRRPVSVLAAGGADLVVAVNASPFEAGKRGERDALIRRHGGEIGLPILYVNTVGAADVGKNVVVFDGDSLAYDGSGAPVARGAQFEPDRVRVMVDPDDGTVTPVDPDVEGVEFSDEGIALECREQEVYEALVLALRDYARKTGFERVIEPVSGGIDSSLGLAICVEALGPENVVAYNLPSEVNTETTKALAAEVAENLGVEYHVLPIQDIYDTILEGYGTHVEEVRTATAKENVYARIRGLLMMIASNDSRATAPAMLVTNGNETELAVGYVTLYGDMAGGLSLLGDVSKRGVYALARYVNERHGEAVIPEETFEIPPSAELRPGQVDPFDYDVVSPVVTDLLELRFSPAEIVARFEARELDPDRYDDVDGPSVYDRYDTDAFADLVYDTARRMREAAFKRVQAPPVVAVSKRAFGTDFREPVINGWDGRASEN